MSSQPPTQLGHVRPEAGDPATGRALGASGSYEPAGQVETQIGHRRTTNVERRRHDLRCERQKVEKVSHSATREASFVAEGFISPEALAELLGIPIRTIYSWRSRGLGPPPYRIGKHVRFRLEDVDRWLETRADRPKDPAATP